MLRIDYGRGPDGRARFTARGEGARDDALDATVRRWPGWRRLPFGSTYSAPDYPASVLGVASQAVRIEWSPAAAERRQQLMEQLTSARQALAMQDAPRLNLPRSARQPRPHQARAILALRHLGYRAMLNDDMGLGKSATALWAMFDARVRHLTIVCPASVKWNWQREVELTLPQGGFLESPTDHLIYLIDGTPKKRASIFADLAHAVGQDQGTVTIVNYDLLKHLTEEQRHTLAQATEAVILDESHYIKNRKAERTKLCMQLFGHASQRILMTGTPVMNTIEDLYSQVTFARPGTWPSHNEFSKRHLIVRPMMFGNQKRPRLTTVGVKDIAGLNAVVNTLQIRRKKSEVLDLPPKIHTFPELELCSTTKHVYKAMREFGILELEKLDENEVIWSPRVKSAAMEVMLRCEQIAQGFCGGIPEPLIEKLGRYELKARRIPGRDEIIWPKAPKVQWLLETTTTLLRQDSPVVIMSRFNAPLAWFEHVLAKDEVRVGKLLGGMTAKQKWDVIEAFQEGQLDVVLCQVKCAEGFNLTASRDVIFYGRDWSPAKNSQAEDRCHRDGTKGTVNVQVPIVRETIEVYIHRKLAAKEANAAQALNEMTVGELKEAL